MRKLQKNTNGDWSDIVSLDELVDGDEYRMQIGGKGWHTQIYKQPAPTVNVKFVGMGYFGELLPDSVIVELEDIKNNVAATQGRRQAASRVLMRIYSNISIDVLHDNFSTLLGLLVSNTSLTTGQANSILSTLQEG